MVTIHTYQAGYCTHPECMVLSGGKWAVCQFPARVFLLQVGHRLWLWDTGYAEHFFDASQGIYQLYRRVTPVHFDPKDAIVNQLKSAGVQARDLSGIIVSHFHADHIAGLKDFAQIPIIASQEGWQKVRGLKHLLALRQGFLPDLIPHDIDGRIQFIEAFQSCSLPKELSPFNTAYILPDSQGEICLVPLSGHAHGHYGAFVQTESGWKLLASDSAWTPQNYQELAMPSLLTYIIMANKNAYQQTLQKLHYLHSKRPDIDIILSHENDGITL